MDDKIMAAIKNYCDANVATVSSDGMLKIKKEVINYLVEQFPNEHIEALSDEFIGVVISHVVEVYLSMDVSVSDVAYVSDSNVSVVSEVAMTNVEVSPVMDENHYWELIHNAKSSGEDRTTFFVRELAKMSVKNIVLFELLTQRFIKVMRNNPFRDTLESLGVDVSSGKLEFFLRWVVSEGKETYEFVRKNYSNAEKMEEVVSGGDDLPGYEEFAYFPAYAYAKKKETFETDKNAVDADRLFLLVTENYNDAYDIIKRELEFGAA